MFDITVEARTMTGRLNLITCTEVPLGIKLYNASLLAFGSTTYFSNSKSWLIFVARRLRQADIFGVP